MVTDIIAYFSKLAIKLLHRELRRHECWMVMHGNTRVALELKRKTNSIKTTETEKRQD